MWPGQNAQLSRPFHDRAARSAPGPATELTKVCCRFTGGSPAPMRYQALPDRPRALSMLHHATCHFSTHRSNRLDLACWVCRLVPCARPDAPWRRAGIDDYSAPKRLHAHGQWLPNSRYLRGLDGVVLAAERDEPVDEHPKKPLPFLRRRHKGIAHHPVRHLPSSLRKVGVAADFGSELEPPVVLHRQRHVDQLRPQMKLQTRLPLSAVADTPRIGLAPGQQLIRRHIPVG